MAKNKTNLTEKQIEEEAYKVIRGDYGNGDARKEKLGDNYSAVQNKVNQLSKQAGGVSNVKTPSTSVSTPKSTSQTVKTTTDKSKTTSSASSVANKNNIKTSSTANPKYNTKTDTSNTSTTKKKNASKIDTTNKSSNTVSGTLPFLSSEYKNTDVANANTSSTGKVQTLEKNKNLITLEKADGTTKQVETKAVNNPKISLTDDEYKVLRSVTDQMGEGNTAIKLIDSSKVSGGDDIVSKTKAIGEKYGVSTSDLFKAYSEEKSKKDKEFGESHPILASLKTTLQKSAQTPIENALSIGTNLIAPNSRAAEDTNAHMKARNSEIADNRSGVKSNMGGAGETVYDLASGVADRIGAQTFGKAISGGNQIVGAAMSGFNTAGDYLANAQDRGIDNRKAAITGLVNGTVDAALDVAGLDKVGALQPSGQIAKDIAKKFGIGAGEQGITYIIQEVTDNLVNGKDSVYSNNKQNYMAQGMSESEATKQAFVDEAVELGKETATGGLFSVGMDAINKGVGKILGGNKITDTNVKNNELDAAKQGEITDNNVKTKDNITPEQQAELDAQLDNDITNLLNNLDNTRVADTIPVSDTVGTPIVTDANGNRIVPNNGEKITSSDVNNNRIPNPKNLEAQSEVINNNIIPFVNRNAEKGQTVNNEVGDSYVPPSTNVKDNTPKGKVSQARTGTMEKSGIVDTQVAAQKSPLEMFTYEPVGEQESVKQALDYINKKTPQGAMEELMKKDGLTGVEMDAMMSLWDSTVTRAQELDAQGYDSKEQWDLSNKIFKKIQEQSTNKAQGLQALAKWSRNTAVGLLTEAERIINANAYNNDSDSALTKELKKHLPKEKIELSSDFMKDFLNLAKQFESIGDKDSRVAKDLMAQMGRLVNAQMPSTLSERVVTGLMDNMLGNFRTLITRNAGGNIGFNALEQVKKPIAATIDKGLSKFTGKRTTSGLTKSGLLDYFNGFSKGLKDEAQDFKTGLHTARSGENNLGTAVANNRHVFKERGSILPDNVWDKISNNPVSSGGYWLLDKADSLVHNGLSVGDRPFYEATYAQTLNEYRDLRSRGLMGDVIQGLSDEEFDNYSKAAAKINALASVYQDDSELAKGLLKGKQAISDISKGVFGADILSQFSMPFVKTPANLITRSIEYSPFGLVKNAVNTAKEGFTKTNEGSGVKFSADNLDQSRIANETARNILGLTLWGGALGLASNGNLTGAYSEDKDMKQAQKNAGMQEYALTDGKRDMDISWIPVIGNNLVAGASTYDKLQDPDASLLEKIGTGSKAGLKSLLDQSVFQGLQELFGGNNQYNSEQGITENVVNTVKEGTSQAIPSMLRQIGQVTDKYERNLGDGDREYWQNSLMNSIPSLRQELPIKYDSEGNPILQNQGRGVGSKILEDMILPGKITERKDSKVNDEAMRIYNDAKEKDAFITKPERSELGRFDTDQRFSAYTRTLQQGKNEVASLIMDSDVYKSLSDSEKNRVLADCYSAVKGSIRQKYNEDYTTDDTYSAIYSQYGAEGLAEALLNNTYNKKQASKYGFVSKDGTPNANAYIKAYEIFDGNAEDIALVGDAISKCQEDMGETLNGSTSYANLMTYFNGTDYTEEEKGKIFYALRGDRLSNEAYGMYDEGGYTGLYNYLTGKADLDDAKWSATEETPTTGNGKFDNFTPRSVELPTNTFNGSNPTNSIKVENTTNSVKTIPSPSSLGNTASSNMIRQNVERMEAEQKAEEEHQQAIANFDLDSYTSGTSNGGTRFNEKEGLLALKEVYKTDAGCSQALIDGGVSTKGVNKTREVFGDDYVYTYYEIKAGADANGDSHVTKKELVPYLQSQGMSQAEIDKWWSVYK